MKQKRFLVAATGLMLLFLYAWTGYFARESRACTIIKESKRQVPCEIAVQKNQIGEDGQNKTADPYIEITTEEKKENKYQNRERKLQFSKEEYQVLLRIVEAEATGGSQKSKRMVANVVLNRVKDKRFPDTISQVVFQRGVDGTAQFSPTADGRYEKVKITKETKRAVKDVLQGKDETNGALFFLNRRSASTRSVAWFDQELRLITECGGHSYYAYK